MKQRITKCTYFSEFVVPLSGAAVGPPDMQVIALIQRKTSPSLISYWFYCVMRNVTQTVEAATSSERY